MKSVLTSRRRVAGGLFACAAVLAGLAPGLATAQAFPNKPVRLVVTYPPGGSSDLMARIMAGKLSELWGHQVLIESKPGAAGSIGMEFAARQAPDGYTFVIGNLGPAAVNPLISKVPYNMDKDFIPVMLTATGPNIMVVPANSPYRTLADLLADTRAKPGAISFGTSGPGSMSHLSTELLMREAKIKMVNVPYKGGGQAVNDLLGGQLGFMISDALPVAQFIKTNRLRPLAITSGARSPLFPDIPTMAEAGYPGYEDVTLNMLLAPAGTPKEIVAKIHADVAKAFAQPDLVARFVERSIELVASPSPEDFGQLIRSEVARLGKVAREAGIKAE